MHNIKKFAEDLKRGDYSFNKMALAYALEKIYELNIKIKELEKEINQIKNGTKR